MVDDDSRRLHVLKIAGNLSSLTTIVFKLKRNYSNRYIKHICFPISIFRVSKCSYNFDLNKQCARLQPAGSIQSPARSKVNKEKYILSNVRRYTSGQCCLQGLSLRKKSAIKVARAEWGGKFFPSKFVQAFTF